MSTSCTFFEPLPSNLRVNVHILGGLPQQSHFNIVNSFPEIAQSELCDDEVAAASALCLESPLCNYLGEEL